MHAVTSYTLYAVCMSAGAIVGALSAHHLQAAYERLTSWRRERFTKRARALIHFSEHHATYARDLAEAERSKTK